MKLILCDGDSWTAGDIINPELKLINENHANVNDPLNDSYRLPKVWPHKLGKLLNIDTLNIAHAGSSNDAIVRRTMRKVKELLLDYEAKDLFVIIGWSSPERKDFYYTGEWDAWETIHPVSNYQPIPDKDIDTFYQIYREKFWNEQEYVERYIQQNLLLHYFLKEHNVKHLFFDAFYETRGHRSMFNSLNIDDVIISSGYETESHYALMKYFLKVKKEFSLNDSFRNLLLDKNKVFEYNGKQLNSFKEELFNTKDHHPSEKGHEIWAKNLFNELRDKINE
jgi:hypothetical protein|tara:strand:+ start:319 stop:1158 length:840 start_codon:yes stop_codon:yes gene_type:complete